MKGNFDEGRLDQRQAGLALLSATRHWDRSIVGVKTKGDQLSERGLGLRGIFVGCVDLTRGAGIGSEYHQAHD
jgi:hypothetical protein